MYSKGLLGKVFGAFLGGIAFLLSAQVLAEATDLVSTLASDQHGDFDAASIKSLVSAINKGSDDVSESQKRAVVYYCYADELEVSDIDYSVGMAEFSKRKKKRAEYLDRCYGELLSVYKAMVENGNKEKGVIENKNKLESIYKKNKKSMIGETFYINVDGEFPVLIFSNKGPARKIKLAEHFSLRRKPGENNAGKSGLGNKEVVGAEKVNADLSFSVEGCVPESAEDGPESQDKENEEKEIRKLKSRLKAIEENQKGNMPVTCTIDDAGVLTVSPKSAVSGSRDLHVTASYVEGGAVIAEEEAGIPVNVSSFKAQGCSAWNCQSHYSFLLGAEGTSMSEVKKETILRYEFASYHMLSDNFHMFGRIFQTSTPDEDSCEGEAEDCEEALIEAITADIGGNYLFWESPRANEEGKHVLRGGLTAQYGIYKSGNADRDFAEYYYSGIRFAHHKQRYFDILYGKREDLLGRRIKFKGQVPVYNDNFVVGVEIEVAADGDMRKVGLSNQDSIKAFVLYQVDFAGFIK